MSFIHTYMIYVHMYVRVCACRVCALTEHKKEVKDLKYTLDVADKALEDMERKVVLNMNIQVYIYIYIYIYMYINIYIYIHIHIQIYIYIYVDIFIYIYVYIYIKVYI